MNRHKRYYDDLKQQGRCVKCKHRKAVLGRVRCKRCADYEDRNGAKPAPKPKPEAQPDVNGGALLSRCLATASQAYFGVQRLRTMCQFCGDGEVAVPGERCKACEIDRRPRVKTQKKMEVEVGMWIGTVDPLGKWQ